MAVADPLEDLAHVFFDPYPTKFDSFEVLVKVHLARLLYEENSVVFHHHIVQFDDVIVLEIKQDSNFADGS